MVYFYIIIIFPAHRIGIETLQLEPIPSSSSSSSSTPSPSQRETQLARGITSFYRVIASFAKKRVDLEAVNWNYAKLTHFLRPALSQDTHTMMMVCVDPRRDHEVSDDDGDNNK